MKKLALLGSSRAAVGFALGLGIFLGILVVPGILSLANHAARIPVVAANNDDDADMITYEVTIENLTTGQPLSFPVAATHRGTIRMFTVGKLASKQLEVMAETGAPFPMFELFSKSKAVTQAVNVGVPVLPKGIKTPDHPEWENRVTFEITAYLPGDGDGDRFSLSTMLVCTNDGITGLDAVILPTKGKKIYYIDGYDAGTEDNTELSEDIVDPCSTPGLRAALPGDPDGNLDKPVDSKPHQPIGLHPGIQGSGELSTKIHGWRDPVARVTLEVVDGD